MIPLDSFVEARICSVSFSDTQKEVSLGLALAGGERKTLRIVGVDRFVANDLRENNIVDRILIWDRSRGQQALRAAISTLVYGSEPPSNSDPREVIVDREVAAVERGEKSLVEIEPVYGAAIVALAEGLAC